MNGLWFPGNGAGWVDVQRLWLELECAWWQARMALCCWWELPNP